MVSGKILSRSLTQKIIPERHCRSYLTNSWQNHKERQGHEQNSHKTHVPNNGHCESNSTSQMELVRKNKQNRKNKQIKNHSLFNLWWKVYIQTATSICFVLFYFPYEILPKFSVNINLQHPIYLLIGWLPI